MGTGISTALIYVGTAPGWQETGRGPRLRQLFGGYRGHDIWGILRKTKSMEDDQGYLGFEEVQDLLCLKAPSMLFLWDIFSQQNELCSINELLTVACVFSSALLDEKARFLHAVFDASGRGLGTGSEIASICLMVLTVLGKVTGAVAKAKEVTPQLMVELEKLVPPYAAALVQQLCEHLSSALFHNLYLWGSSGFLRYQLPVAAMEISEAEMQKKAQAVLDGVLQRVSRILNERAGQPAEEEPAAELDDFDPNDPDLLLRPSDNILTRRDSRCIIMDAFELGREFPEVDIDPRLVFDNPTIEQLSQAIVDLPKTQRTKSLESQSTAHPHAGHDMAPFTQLTAGAMAVVSTPYKGIDTSGLRFSRATDGMECIRVPGGEVRIGDDSMQSERDNEGPSHLVHLSSFLMDVEPVSMSAFARFLNAAQPTQDELFDWCLLPAEDARCCHIPLTLTETGWQVKTGVPPNWPMILVSWYGANAYALWAHGRDWHGYKSANESFLPTEAQWEYAARGAEPLQYPWGNEEATAELLNVCWDTSAYDNKGNMAAHVAAPLEELPLVGVNACLGVSPFGFRGMAGNVWQWCRDTKLGGPRVARAQQLPQRPAPRGQGAMLGLPVHGTCVHPGELSVVSCISFARLHFEVLPACGRLTTRRFNGQNRELAFLAVSSRLEPPVQHAEAVQIYGSKEAFQRERVIGQLELDRILTPSIRDAYETLPLTTEPVTDTEPPPPPGWASTQKSLTRSATTEDVQSVRRDRDQKEPKDFLPRGANPAEKHLAWTRRLEETDNFVVDADAYGDLDATVHRWLIMQDHEFSSIAKDLPGFRLSFCKSVCSSLGLPAHGNCVEVVNVTNGSATAIIAEFLMRPRSHTDSRSGLELAQLLEKQITSPYSALRRGPIGKYLGNAFLLSAAPQTVCDSELLGPEESQGTFSRYRYVVQHAPDRLYRQRLAELGSCQRLSPDLLTLSTEQLQLWLGLPGQPSLFLEPVAEILASTGEGGNYGDIVRVHMALDHAPLPSIIAKQIRPKAGLEVGEMLTLTEHSRFMQGFHVEAAAYKNLSEELLAADLAVPRVLHVEEVELGDPFVILLEEHRATEQLASDLSLRFPRGAGAAVRHFHGAETLAALRWLAGFHALFWEIRGQATDWIVMEATPPPRGMASRKPFAEQRGLWQQGSYWILDKLGQRPDCTARALMMPNLLWPALARAGRDPEHPAKTDSRFRTLVHGDAKPENMLCSHGPAPRCAALDFGWVGEGYGVRDVAYLLWDQIATNVVEDGWELGFKGGTYFWAMPWAIQTLRTVLDQLDGGDVKLPATVQDGEAQTDSYELGTPRAAVIRGAAACGACSRQEEEDFIEQIRDAVRQLQDARQRQIKAKAGEQRALEEIRKREAMIEQLRDDLA
eukprot:s2250_g10.t2